MAAVIQFTNIPPSLRVPGTFVEVDASQANTLQQNQVTLLIGQMLSTGVATANTPIISTSLSDAKVNFGIGSMLANMLAQYNKTDSNAEIWLAGVPDSDAGAFATGTITFGSSPSAQDATANGTLALYLGGVSVPVLVLANQTNQTIAGNVEAAIAALPDLPVTASVFQNVVTLTANHAGVAAMDCNIQVNYLGALNNESIPSGLTVNIAQMSGGTEDPDISTVLSNLSNQPFDFIGVPYTGSANLNAFDTFMSDVNGRWSYSSEVYGGGFTAVRGNFAALVSFGNSRNDQHTSVLGFDQSPTPAYLVAADYTAACASSLRVDPALPLGGAGDGVTMNWLAPPVPAQFDFTERNSLLFDGVSTYLVEQGSRVRIEYAVTTYQVNGVGQPDDSYLDVETMYTLIFLIRAFRTDLSTKFARKKLIADGARIGAGSNFVTSQVILNECNALYAFYAAQGMCQNPTIFAQNSAANNAGNGTVQLYLPFDLANQLRRVEMLIRFTKS